MERENLFFIAIIPPKEICDAVSAFKLDFARRFESRTALKVIPHITLKAPFKLAITKQPDLQQWFQKLLLRSGPFQLELRNFGAFHNKNHPVIYVQPIMNTPLLSLQEQMIRSFQLYYPDLQVPDTELKFTPHITIAYRDLRFDKFLEAWKEYQTKEYKAVFDVNNFHLMQHDGRAWNIIDTYLIK